MRILIVDGEASSRAELSKWLTTHGFDVVGEVSGGIEAVTRADMLRPDAILQNPLPPAASLPAAEAVMAERLTDGERRVLQALAEGASNREIASTLCIAESTVKYHLHNILTKLSLHHRAQVVAYAARERYGAALAASVQRTSVLGEITAAAEG